MILKTGKKKTEKEINRPADDKTDISKILAEIERSIPIESHLDCTDYRSSISRGISITEKETTVTFTSAPDNTAPADFSVPSLILFDSYDRMVHDSEKDIIDMRYTEYGELWFDGHVISTYARNVVVRPLSDAVLEEEKTGGQKEYSVKAVKYRDHARIRISDGTLRHEVIVALPDSSRDFYIGINGEHCIIDKITVTNSDIAVSEGDIERIADEISYINHIEGDIPNIQADSNRSAYTKGIRVKDGMRLYFRSLSLPTASLVWHCPYVLLFSSNDGKVNGENYKEIALIRFNGELKCGSEYAEGRITVDKMPDFGDWEEWKKKNLKGYKSMVYFDRTGSRITVTTENAGISLKCSVRIKKNVKTVYAALTGDQCALTNIMIV